MMAQAKAGVTEFTASHCSKTSPDQRRTIGREWREMNRNW